MRPYVKYNNYSGLNCEELKGFQIKNQLGKGSFANVYKVVRLEDGQEYAMKKIKLNSMPLKDMQNAVNEVRFLASLKSPFVVSYKESIFSESHKELYIIMEFMGGGDLLGLIQKYKNANKYIEEEAIWRYLAQLTLGLKTLHDLNIFHRDIKCQNIFLNSDRKEVKIGDLNVSKVAKQGMLSTQVGTPYYASPEIWKDKPYNSKSDIWSLGCVIYEMCTLHPPFKGSNMNMLFQQVKQGNYTPISKYYSKDLSKFLSSCLKVNPKQRPSCNDILQLEKVKQQVVKLSSTQSRKISLRIDDNKENINFNNNMNNMMSSNSSSGLINTIKVTKNLKNLCQKLPQQKYYNQNPQFSIDLSLVYDEEKSEGLKEKVASLPVINQRDLSLDTKLQQQESLKNKLNSCKNDNKKNINLPVIENSSFLSDVMDKDPKNKLKKNNILLQHEKLDRELQYVQKQYDMQQQIIQKQKQIKNTNNDYQSQLKQQCSKVQEVLTQITSSNKKINRQQQGSPPPMSRKSEAISNLYQVRNKSSSNKNPKGIKVCRNDAIDGKLNNITNTRQQQQDCVGQISERKNLHNNKYNY